MVYQSMPEIKASCASPCGASGFELIALPAGLELIPAAKAPGQYNLTKQKL